MDAAPCHPPVCASTSTILVQTLAALCCHAQGWERARQTANSDQRFWPHGRMSQILYRQPHRCREVSRQHGSTSQRLTSVTSRCTSSTVFHLQAVNSMRIPAFTQGSLTLNLRLHRTFRWIFVVTDIRSAILAADFLTKHGLLVDVKQQRLLDATTLFSIQGVAVTAAGDVAPCCAAVA